ncbi:Bowman-Birk type proteinase inhibitor-like [Magnolia sinica]|uniref:Bowman-Birk type proteinase inhibitor-like n=1 Tax=Magnolia sinica TaxID=86752 RepID=UPI00265A0F34|nr:Bowman-Birk type proteinase inhibitor-like [Magnolia sinica]
MEKKGLSVVLMVAIFATSFLELHARVDLLTAFTAGVDGGKDEPCCNECICPLIFPRKCYCTYVQKGSCPAPCGSPCICDKSAWPTCGCTVVKNSCANTCKTTGIEK